MCENCKKYLEGKNAFTNKKWESTVYPGIKSLNLYCKLCGSCLDSIAECDILKTKIKID